MEKMENKQQKILLELISSKDKTFDSESLRTVAELCYPTGNVKYLVKKINIPEIFGDAVSRSSAPGKLGRRKYLYTFKATAEELVDRVNKFYSGKRRVTAAVGLGIAEKSVIELVYTYITELPTTNTEFKKKFGVNPPSEDLVKTLLKKFCNIKGEFTITKVGTSKVKDFEASDDTKDIIGQIDLMKKYYHNTYKEDLVPYTSKMSSVSKNDRNSDDKKPNAYFIPDKRYENVYSGLKLAIGNDLDIKISTLLLNKMIEINKDMLYYDSCFSALKDAELELPKGFNLDQWVKKSYLFKASYDKLYLDPKYKNLIKSDEKTGEDKKEEKTEEQLTSELTIHVISQDRLRSLKYTSIKLVEELKDSDYRLYQITVDFNKAKSILDTFGILSSLDRNNGVIVEKDLAEKVKNFVMDSLEAKLQEK